MTDAMACWFLKTYEDGHKPWIIINHFKTKKSFISYISKLRKDGDLKNDDITLLTIKIT
jgi:hypothetical protein